MTTVSTKKSGKNKNLVTQMLTGIEYKDSRLSSALLTIIDDLYALDDQINPPVIVSQSLNPSGNVVSVNAPTNFILTVFENNIRLNWTAPDNGTFLYEIRLGPVYDTAAILLTTATLSADIDPISRAIITDADYTFWIATIDDLGNHSIPAQVTVHIPNIGAPIVSATVIGNSVLLRWTRPTSTFTIAYYNVYKNLTLVGRINGTFDVLFENVGGSFDYNVQAVDIVGSLGEPSPTVSLTLSDPPDYTPVGEILSTLNGAKVRAVIDSDGSLFAPINDTETYQEHFDNNTFTTWQDPIDAGYPLYFEPGPNLNATYTEIFDFGFIVTNVIINLTYNTSRQNGIVSISFGMEVSEDGIGWDLMQIATSRFALSMRYVRVTVTFTVIDDKSSINFFDFKITTSVHLQIDEGKVNAIATDVPGTPVTFTKFFKAPPNLVLIPSSTTSVYPTYTNLTTGGFDVLVFDAAGVRISRTITWIARGIV